MIDGPTAIVVGGLAPGLAVTRSLGRRGVTVLIATHSPDEPAVSSRYTSGVILTPNPAVNPDGFVTALRDALPNGEPAVIIPSEDVAITAVAHNLDRLADRFIVAGPSWPVAEWFIDKRKTALLADEVGVRAPRFSVPTNAEHAAEIGENLRYPALVKPSQGHVFTRQTGRKMIAVNNRQELIDAVHICTQVGVEPLVQEIIPGPPENGANHIVYVSDGQIVAEFTARKIRNWPTDWGSPSALISERIEGLSERTLSLLEAAGYEGMACAEYKFDPRCNDYQLMEVNVRHNLSGSLAPRCGVDFPWIDYASRIGLDPGEGVPTGDFEEGVHWVDGFRDAAAVATTGTWWRDPRGALVPYRGTGARAFFNPGDMAPFRKRGTQLGRKAVTRVRERIGFS